MVIRANEGMGYFRRLMVMTPIAPPNQLSGESIAPAGAIETPGLTSFRWAPRLRAPHVRPARGNLRRPASATGPATVVGVLQSWQELSMFK
jgi:hypothetical protein